ncbi:unnamed protein product [Danaus chrysippus]|uniref:(African queen) hypothetical protein n=1 Tax=Danaus chrysippus TaxID=151541 RepID=A0A8J2VVN1_9NEOP|nr:unnamed protein product [Danaus chrysippus]
MRSVIVLLFGIAVTTAAKAPCVELNNGIFMPVVALGTGRGTASESAPLDEVRQSVYWAIEAGYRHVDTAAIYGDEQQVGEGVAQAIANGLVSREEMFITTKDDGKVLDIDYLETWKGMEEAKDLGLARSIGVSNFNASQISNLVSNARIWPVVNEVEIERGLVPIPKSTNQKRLAQNIDLFDFSLTNEEVALISRFNKNIDRNLPIIPKSTNKDRIKQNIDIFDFSLTDEEIGIINKFNKNIRVIIHAEWIESVHYPFDDIKITELKDVVSSVICAIETGYRHFDTAPLYFNEAQIGEAIINATERGIVRRKDLFITTKLDAYSDRSAVIPAIRGSLQRLQLSYVDLFLIHTSENVPTGTQIDFLDIWKGMEEVKMMGLARSIGVSNFDSKQINTILAHSRIRPSVNQIEVNPTFVNLDLVSYCENEDIAVMAYSPFGLLVPRPFKNTTNNLTFDDPTFVKLSRKYYKTSSQIVLRYLIDRGTVPIPKAFNKEHIKSNFNVLNFKLTDKEVYEINELDRNIKLYNFDENVENLYEYYFGTNSSEVWSRAANMNEHQQPQAANETGIKDVITIPKTVVKAIESGYRHFDTAPLYFNEVQVGEAIVNAIESGLVDRKDLFITTKLDIYSNRSEVVPALKRSLQRLQLAYVDLYLVHIPFDVLTGKEINCIDIWKGMEEAKLLGLTNSIGISNFNRSQIDKILKTCNIKPAVIQVEVSPTFTNIDLVDYCQSHHIHVTAFSPFGFLAPRPFRNFSSSTNFHNSTLMNIAEKHNKTPSQIVLRYLIDRGITPISDSSNRDYMKLNFNVFDFSLTQSEVDRINGLNISEAVYNFDKLDNLYPYFFDTDMEEVFKIVNEM